MINKERWMRFHGVSTMKAGDQILKYLTGNQVYMDKIKQIPQSRLFGRDFFVSEHRQYKPKFFQRAIRDYFQNYIVLITAIFNHYVSFGQLHAYIYHHNYSNTRFNLKMEVVTNKLKLISPNEKRIIKLSSFYHYLLHVQKWFNWSKQRGGVTAKQYVQCNYFPRHTSC